MTAAGSTPHGAGASIGTVLGRLRPEFPDVTISKIRFLESEGLIRPRRTASGYRQFFPADIERLRFILAAQRDQYLPLKVIKEQLDQADRAGSTGPRQLVALGSESGSDAHDPASDRARLTKEELVNRAEVTAATLAELETYGIVASGPAGFYSPEAVQLARTAAALIDFGLEPRHLRTFRTAADRHVGLLTHLVAPIGHQRDPDAPQRADELARELSVLSVRLHALLVQAGLRDARGR